MASPRQNRTGADHGVLSCDVLVVGGGPAAAWAALSAAEAGARVVVSDKGYLGTSGATAPSNTGTWCVPPGEASATAVEQRWKRTASLADKRWMLRCVDRSFENLQKLVEWGYPFPNDDGGNLYVANLRGPDYMRFMRRRMLAAGIRILDHHPVLELLGDSRSVTGAAGMSRASGESSRVDAGAVVLATGGCAFFERILGATGLTGDGSLFAAEAGAALSGMEFTGKYTLGPHGSSLNKGLPFRWASFYDADGQPLRDSEGQPVTNGIGPGERAVAAALMRGPVYARLDHADEGLQDALRRGQPNCFLPYERMGVDPFRDLFRVDLKFEGTIRGTGGIRIVSSDCSTGVPGLYAAGDAASRENVTGGVSGGGAINASWAMASGWWAGHGAAGYARRHRADETRTPEPLGTAGLRPLGEAKPIDLGLAAWALHAEIAPLDRNYRRSAAGLAASTERVEAVWQNISRHLRSEGRERLRAREVAAVAANTRWTLAAATLRTESRGVHRRSDFPETNDDCARRIVVSGLSALEVDWETPAEAERIEEAAS